MKPVAYATVLALLLAIPFVLRCRHNRGAVAQPVEHAGLAQDSRKYDIEELLT